MSHWATSFVISKHITSSPQKLLLLVLASRVNHDVDHQYPFRCVPGQKALAEEASMSERQVRANLKALEDGGYIIRHQRRRSDGTRSSDSYEIVGFEAFFYEAKGIAERTKQQPAENRHMPDDQPAVLGSTNRRKTAGQYIANAISKPEGEPLERVRAKRKSVLDPETPINQKQFEYAVEKNVSPPVIAAEWERFKNHHVAKNSKFTDWNRAWYNWVTSPYFGGSNGKSTNKPDSGNGTISLLERAAERGIGLQPQSDRANEDGQPDVPRGSVEVDYPDQGFWADQGVR